MKKVAWLVFWFAGCISQVSSVEAFNLNEFKQLVIFGDSLSDNGNSYALTSQLPPADRQPPDPPYYQGRWTNGPNWVDYFPSIADFPSVAGQPEAITPFFANPDTGTNVAVGGSTSFPVTGSSSTSPTSLAVQIGDFVAQHGGRIPGNDLYMIWIGANDFPGGITDPKVTVAAIGAGIAQLRQAGAKSIAVVNVPDISLTPRLRAEGGATVQAAKNFVTAVNIGLQVEAPLLAWSLRVQLQLIDVNGLFTQLVYHPGRFGFTNSSGYALDPSTGGGDTNRDDYVFFDGFHPTTRVHCIAAGYFYEVLTNGAAYPGGRLVLYP